jgi:AraC family transcriptional regulator, regulatory protein of adaptative response / DNA-3-methyladenine glycosylase II
LLPYRPPYDWDAMLEFLRLRAIPGLETIADGVYGRVIELDETAGSISVAHAPDRSALRVVVRFPRLGSLSAIIARVRRMFDLGAEPGAIAAALSADPLLAPLVSARPGLRLPGAWDGFEIAVRAMLGQQITVKAATRLAGQVVAALGPTIAESGDLPGLRHAFPRPERFDLGILSGMGMPKARAAAIAGMAAAVRADPSLLEPGRDLAEAVARLRRLPGVGEWTAQYIAMRALGESDAFLAGDVAVQRRFALLRDRPTTSELLAHAERWRPWRAYAVLHLWTADVAVSRAS